jgi:TetR/AcrR family transcriptional repressor of nem operon
MGRTSDADERLMDAALDLMWEESYGAVTIDDICKRADVKKGSFYYFYHSKADLAVAALEKMWLNDWKPRLDGQFSSSMEPLERLKTYLDSIHPNQDEIKQRTGKVLGCPVCSVGSEISTQEVDVSAKIRELFGRKARYVESALRDAMADGTIEPGDPAKRALVLMTFINGMISQARIMNDPEILKDLTEMGLEILRVKTPAPASSAPLAVT